MRLRNGRKRLKRFLARKSASGGPQAFLQDCIITTITATTNIITNYYHYYLHHNHCHYHYHYDYYYYYWPCLPCFLWASRGCGQPNFEERSPSILGRTHSPTSCHLPWLSHLLSTLVT
jgi:hypothetical protein